MGRVLLVDDDFATRTLLSLMLAEMGYGVASAASGDEGLRYLYSEEACDLVVSDMLMPGMSGIEFAQRISDVRPGLPLIFISGYPRGMDLARKAGTWSLPKPVRPDDLMTVLHEALAS